VSSWSEADRRELARLCAEHDQMMTEHDQWMARREAASGAPVQKSTSSTYARWPTCAVSSTRCALTMLSAAVLARQKAEQELASLHRERAIQRARAAERAPTMPLN